MSVELYQYGTSMFTLQWSVHVQLQHRVTLAVAGKIESGKKYTHKLSTTAKSSQGESCHDQSIFNLCNMQFITNAV